MKHVRRNVTSEWKWLWLQTVSLCENKLMLGHSKKNWDGRLNVINFNFSYGRSLMRKTFCHTYTNKLYTKKSLKFNLKSFHWSMYINSLFRNAQKLYFIFCSRDENLIDLCKKNSYLLKKAFFFVKSENDFSS